VVGGISLLAIFWIIPSQTVAGENFGLSPTMVPIVRASTIGILALTQFATDVCRRASRPGRPGGVGVPAAVVLSAVVGIATIGFAGLVWGGTLLAGLVSVSIGERRPLVLTTIAAAAAALMIFVEQSGL